MHINFEFTQKAIYNINNYKWEHLQDIIDIANIFYFTFQSKSSNYMTYTTMSLKTIHCKMVFEILAISIFFSQI